MPTEIMNSVQLLTLTMVRGIKQSAKIQVQWNPSITDTFGDQHFVRYSEVSPTQELPVLFPVGIVLRNLAVEHNVAVFFELFSAARWQGRLSRD